MEETKKPKKPPRKNALGTEYATPEVTAGRVQAIYETMREGLWQRGKSAEPLAKEWGISKVRVEQLASEAWRRVCAESDDPEKMRPEISAILRTNLQRADKVMNFRAIAQLAETYTKVIGARAPERHEHAVVIAQFETLSIKGKIEWIEARISKLEEAKRALLEASNDESDT